MVYQPLYFANGPQFIAQTFTDFMEAMGIYHHHVTPKWPQANGEVECQNQSLEKRMKIAQAEGRNWKEVTLSYVVAYRAAPHSTTWKSPVELLIGRKIQTKMPELKDVLADQEVRHRDAENKGSAELHA